MHLLPEVRPPLLAWLILTTNSTERFYCAHLPVGMRRVAWLRDLEWLSGPVTRVGQGGAGPGQQRTETSDPRCLWFIMERGNCHMHWFPLCCGLWSINEGNFGLKTYLFLCACCVIIPWYCIVGGRWAPGNWDIWWEAGGVLKLCQHQWNFFTQLQSCKRLHNRHYDHDINILCAWRFFLVTKRKKRDMILISFYSTLN